MGDNVFLGDRNGVRTPMQWTGDRNAGFSRADFAQLYLPPLMDPVYGYQALNVEAQLRTPTRSCAGCTASSRCARSTRCSALGTYEPLRPENPRIFAHVRRYEETSSSASTTSPARRSRSSSTSPRARAGRPRRCSAARRFPPISTLPYLLTLAPRGWFWFRLQARRE